MLNLSDLAKLRRRYHAISEAVKIKIAIEIRVEYSVMPQGVKLRMNPPSGTATTDKPKLKAKLSKPPNWFFLRKTAAVNI